MRSKALFRITYFVLAIIINFSFAAYSQVSDSNQVQFDIPDEEAIYPEGIEAFYQFISKNLVYPISARKSGIEGKLFVSFVVGLDGLIEPATVKTSVSLDTSCDLEAERVIKSNSTIWKPAKKRGKSIRQRLTLPIIFKLDESDLRHTDFEPIEPLKTVVIESSQGKDLGWNVYSDVNIDHKVNRILPGDSVRIIGWAPWLYLINSKSVTGYISYKALLVTKEMKSIVETLRQESENWQRAIDNADSLMRRKQIKTWELVLSKFGKNVDQDIADKRIDSIELQGSPKTFLRISSSVKSIFVGECAVVDLAFYVNDKNQQPLQFYELGQQLGILLNTSLRKDDCWIAANEIGEIVGNQEKIGNEVYTKYSLYNTSYCPMEAKPLVFESVKINMAQMKLANHKEIERIIPYTTKRLSIQVNPLPPVTSTDLLKLNGKFILTDTVISKGTITGQSISYKVSIMGKGLTFPVQPSKFLDRNISSVLIDQNDMDTIINNQYFSKKEFTYSLTFAQSDTYDLSSQVTYLSFDPDTKKIVKLAGKSKIQITKIFDTSASRDLNSFFPKDNLIAVDISKSMQIEDYEPNRLGAVKDGLIGFFNGRRKCDIGLIVFGGDAKQIDNKKEPCYSASLIQSIDQKMVRRGTAIGDAIWLATHSVSKSTSPKKMVLIGDGDNTAGFLVPTAAIHFALKSKLSIYTIGVGSKGLVKYGLDQQGKPFMVDNTFSDVDLKRISLATGGKYFWAKDAEAITRILKEIFSN
jgi:Gram-negative bacterial TonB protein C-terminal/von Willebrand factor type A domain